MCGRTADFHDLDTLYQYYRIVPEAPRLNLEPRYNVPPRSKLSIVREDDEGSYHLDRVRWGLIPFWSKDTKMGDRCINARSETVEKAPAFRAAYKQRRCVIAVSGFYEWQKVDDGKQPHYIGMEDGSPMSMAGLWERWKPEEGDELVTCTIITTIPNSLMEPLHNRMPVILGAERWEGWLKEGGARYLGPCPSDWLITWPVTRDVGSPRNQGPELIEQVAP